MADKLTIDCTSGERRTEPLPQDEDDLRAAAVQVVADAEAQAQADEDAWRDSIRNASTLDELIAVLAGDSDAPGQAERRPAS